MITGIEHVAISTGDFERSLGFYRDLIGMEVLYDGVMAGETYDQITALKEVRGRVAILQLGGTQLEFFEFESPTPKHADPYRSVCDHGITHICFGVSDIQSEYERLKAAGVQFHCPPQQFGEAKATYGRDPDGNIFELLEIHDVAN